MECTDDYAGCASGDSVCSDEDSPGDDSSGACTMDTCRVDGSGGCAGDQCLADSSGECPAGDQCTSDKSNVCQSADTCTTDNSGPCTAHDTCSTDASNTCGTGDTCTTDHSGACTGSDACDADASGDCDAGDTCIGDSSGACTNRDVCVTDNSQGCGSDLCRADQSAPCAASDTCALDLAANPVSDRRTLAQAALREALRILYGLTGLLFLLGLPPTARAAPILSIGSAMLPAPGFETGAVVPAIAAMGPFLRDCDHDGVLEADVDADGLCAGDPEVRDYDADGSRELPGGTIFEGTKAYTCFFVPADVAIVASGELAILASREAAVFGAVRAPAGFSLRSPKPIDLRASAWLAPDGYNLDFATALSSGGPTAPPAPETFVSLCDPCRLGAARLLLLLLQ